MIQVDVVVEDYDVQNLFRDLDRTISGPSLHAFLAGDVSEYFRNNIEERFDEEGDALSGFWPPLKEGTVNIKRNLPGLRGQPDEINIRTGDLFDFVTDEYPTTSGPGWAQVDIPGDPPDALTGRKLEVAQHGSPTNPIQGFGPTPRRPVLATSEMQLGVVLEMLEVHIIQALVSGIGGTII